MTWQLTGYRVLLITIWTDSDDCCSWSIWTDDLQSSGDVDLGDSPEDCTPGVSVPKWGKSTLILMKYYKILEQNCT